MEEELTKAKKYIERIKEENQIKIQSLEANIRMLSDQNEQLIANNKKLQSSISPDKLLPSFVKNILPPSNAAPRQSLRDARKNKEQVEEGLRRDLERVVSQLQKKEAETTELRDRAENFEAQLSMSKTAIINAQKEVTAYRKAAEQKSKELKKAKEWELESRKSQTAQSQTVVEKLSQELIEVQEKLSCAVFQRDSAKDELQNFEEKIDAVRNQAVESKEALEEMKHQYAALQMSAELQENSFLEKQGAHDEEKKSWEIERSRLHTKIEQLDARARNNDDKVARLKEEVEKLEEEIKELRFASDAEREKLEKEKAELEENFREMEQNQKITSRKRNQLVKELKSQLKKEALETQRLKASNSRLEDDIRSSRTSLTTPSPSLRSRSHSPMQPNSLTPSKKGASAPRFPPVPKTAPPVKHGRGSLASSESEVVSALSQKVTDKEEKNYALKQQIKYLEETVREVNEELEKKKSIVRNIIQRTKISALSSGDVEQRIREKNKRSTLAKSSPQELLSKMELFVQETSLQNAHLRRDIDAMGVEIQKLYKENQAFKKKAQDKARKQNPFLE